MKLEVVVVPVSDVDRAKQFYTRLGWREDVDVVGENHFRKVQLTPPGSPTSIHFGNGFPDSDPGSAQGLYLTVENIAAARASLVERGADVGAVFHDARGGLGFSWDAAQRVPGPDPDRRSYASYATFSDPDGNLWIVQELTTRLPGR